MALASGNSTWQVQRYGALWGGWRRLLSRMSHQLPLALWAHKERFTLKSLSELESRSVPPSKSILHLHLHAALATVPVDGKRCLTSLQAKCADKADEACIHISNHLCVARADFTHCSCPTRFPAMADVCSLSSRLQKTVHEISQTIGLPEDQGGAVLVNLWGVQRGWLSLTNGAFACRLSKELQRPQEIKKSSPQAPSTIRTLSVNQSEPSAISLVHIKVDSKPLATASSVSSRRSLA